MASFWRTCSKGRGPPWAATGVLDPKQRLGPSGGGGGVHNGRKGHSDYHTPHPGFRDTRGLFRNFLWVVWPRVGNGAPPGTGPAGPLPCELHGSGRFWWYRHRDDPCCGFTKRGGRQLTLSRSGGRQRTNPPPHLLLELHLFDGLLTLASELFNKVVHN